MDTIAFAQLQMLTDNRSTFLPNDVLTVCIKFTDYFDYSTCTVEEVVEGEISMFPTDSEYHKDSLAKDLRKLLDNEYETDFELKVGTSGESIPVHKAVLCARSPVFEDMLKSEMVECAENFIEVPDFTPETVQLFVRYLYSGLVPDLDPSSALELYKAADKYRVMQLRSQCARVLTSNLCAAYSCRLLSLACAHSDAGLKEKVVEFIHRRPREVLTSPEWAAFKQENPLVAMGVTESLLLT